MQYMDDNPGVRAQCEDHRERGDRCFHCPEHPDSPELAIAALQSELAAERIKREAAERLLSDYKSLIEAQVSTLNEFFPIKCVNAQTLDK